MTPLELAADAVLSAAASGDAELLTVAIERLRVARFAEPPTGYSVVESAGNPGWWYWTCPHDSPWARPGSDRKPTREAAIAACWEHYRSTQECPAQMHAQATPAPVHGQPIPPTAGDVQERGRSTAEALRLAIHVETLAHLTREVAFARTKFPRNKHTLAALVEEVGELAQTLLEGEGVERVKAEAIQVACVAIRIYEEGDSAFVRFADEARAPVETPEGGKS